MPAPHRRSHGPSLAWKIGDNTAARALDDRSNVLASRTRHAKKWEQVAADLNRAEQGRPAAVLDRRKVNENQREALRVENLQRASASAFRKVLDTACPAHGVKPGEPCWWPVALCGDRVLRAGFNGQVSARAMYSRSKR